MDAAVRLVVQPSRGREADRALLEPFGTITRRCPDCGRDHGRPLVAEPARWVSLSRSGGFVAVAFSTVGPVGVDIESEAAVARHATDAFGPGEHPDASTWTAKEAALKADGRGLRVDPRDVRVIDGRIEGLRLVQFTVTDDVVGSLAWFGDSADVEVSGGWAALSHTATDASAGAPRDRAESPTAGP